MSKTFQNKCQYIQRLILKLLNAISIHYDKLLFQLKHYSPSYQLFCFRHTHILKMCM